MNKLIKRIEFYAFLVPIIAVAFVSISHVTSWYGISNPVSWAIYLSVGVEVAALSSLAGFSVGLGKYIYPPFILVTVIQFIGNIFYNFQYIDVNGELFKDWVVLVSPILEVTGIDSTDIDSHKRILAFLEGGFLPPISLFFLHLLIKLSEKIKENETIDMSDLGGDKIKELSTIAGRIEGLSNPVLDDEQLKIMEDYFSKLKSSNNLVDTGNEESIDAGDKEIIVKENVDTDNKKRLKYVKRNG